MKNLKLALTAVLAMAFVSLAFADGTKNQPNPSAKYIFSAKPKTIEVPFEKALQVPGLVQAMHAQLDPSLLIGTPNLHIYVGVVNLNGTIYYISGTWEQWSAFFSPIWKFKTESHRVPGSR